MKNIILEFSGGMELLFDNKHAIEISVPPTISSLAHLLPHVRDTYLKSKPELFMSGQTIRPGVLILINDVDWELEGELDYEIRDGDSIVFISTLHGG